MTHSSPFVFMEMTFRLLTVKKQKQKQKENENSYTQICVFNYLLHPCTTKLSHYLYYKT